MSITLSSLKRAVAIAEKVEALEAELATILGQPSAPVSKAAPELKLEKSPKKKKRKMSAASRAAIAAAQTARWAKVRAARG